ncbi:putative septum site-determining protein MinC [Vibrio chagasii]|nr:putative septum site-determining protein MinC [Vibrio chagasii]
MADIKDYEFHEVKTGKFYCQAVNVKQLDVSRLVSYFEAEAKQFPALFANLNISLNFKEIEFKDDIELVTQIKLYADAIQKLGHTVVGVQGVAPSIVKELGLQPIKESKAKQPNLLSGVSSTEPEVEIIKQEAPVEPVAESLIPVLPELSNKIKVVRGTVRGGQTQMSDGDLLIIGNVAYGAEVGAVGSIVVWGRLEGRAHAGSGEEPQNKDAFVLASYFNPELVSINGLYDTSASLDEGVNKDFMRKSTLVKIDTNNNKLEFFRG